MEHEYNTVEEALEDLKQGKIVLVTDDENRENEGDMICAAEFATQENINFMASYAKGLICTPMSVELAEKLGFVPMVTKIPTTMRQHLRFQLIIKIRQQAFPQQSVDLPCGCVWMRTFRQRISESRGMYFR